MIFMKRYHGQDLYLYESGFEVCKSDKPFEFIPIDYFLLHYCVSGEGFLILHNDERHITAGDIFLIPPNTANKYYPFPENPWSYRWVGIKGSMVKSILEECGLSYDNFVLHYDKDDAVLRCFQQIYERCTKSDYYTALGYLYQFFGTLTEKRNSILLESKTIHRQRLEKIIKYIYAQYANNISIQSVAEEFNRDRTYIYKLFKKETGISPKQYLLNFRIEKACDLLCKSHMSVTEIGYMVGFNSFSCFSKQFCLKKGTSPMKYRKQFIK